MHVHLNLGRLSESGCLPDTCLSFPEVAGGQSTSGISPTPPLLELCRCGESSLAEQELRRMELNGEKVTRQEILFKVSQMKASIAEKPRNVFSACARPCPEPRPLNKRLSHPRPKRIHFYAKFMRWSRAWKRESARYGSSDGGVGRTMSERSRRRYAPSSAPNIASTSPVAA